jgi:hypothetical protein
MTGLSLPDEAGHFMLILQRATLPRFASDNRMSGTAGGVLFADSQPAHHLQSAGQCQMPLGLTLHTATMAEMMRVAIGDTVPAFVPALCAQTHHVTFLLLDPVSATDSSSQG